MIRGKKRVKKTFIFLIFSFVSINLFAQEETIFPYYFKLDTAVTGRIIGEGNLFPNKSLSLISYIPRYASKNKTTRIDILNSDYSVIHQIKFDSSNVRVDFPPIVFDFDGDSYDELLFAVSKNDSVSFHYFDPSDNPATDKIILTLHFPSKMNTRLSLAQLDNDKTPEVIAYLSRASIYSPPLNKLLAFDVITKKILWEKLTAEQISFRNPINFVDNKNSYLIYSTTGNSSTSKLIFSNGKFFFSSPQKGTVIYDENFNKYKNVSVDTSAEDYTTNTEALIKAIDINGKTIWQRKLGGSATKTKIDTLTINGKKKLLLLIYNEKAFSKRKSRIEIINPENGKTEKMLLLHKQLKRSYISRNKIYLSFNDYTLIRYDSLLTPLDSVKAKSIMYEPFALTSDNFLLTKRSPTFLQKIFAFDDNLNILAKIVSRGIVSYYPKSGLISIHYPVTRKSTLYSLISKKWYEKIHMSTIRNIIIALLLILIVIIILWTNTLRVSWKKIKTQKDDLEKTHRQLKETTQKLIEAEKLAVYGTLISSIAHEINSPLGAIINSAQRIKNNPKANLEENVDLIERAGKRSKAIIEKLLLGTRNKNKTEKANYSEVLNDWMVLSQKQFSNLGIKFEKEIDCNVDLAISSTELNQIFTNLFMNARDSIIEKNGENKKISIKANNIDNNNCKIIIRDTGTGFSKSKLENPFEAFDTSKEQGKGTGLGLWVIKNILDKIGGKIFIRNYNEGAEIELIIPIYSGTSNDGK